MLLYNFYFAAATTVLCYQKELLFVNLENKS